MLQPRAELISTFCVGGKAGSFPAVMPGCRLTPDPTLARLVHVITVNMHEAKTRLSELVKAVEAHGETVILCRNGSRVAEIRAVKRKRVDRMRILPDPALRVELVPGYDPAEPLSEGEWPLDSR